VKAPQSSAGVKHGHNILLNLYDELVESGHISDDVAQRDILAALQALMFQLVRGHNEKPPFYARWLKKREAAERVQGLYIWGNVGRGKSMLMDLFFHNVPDIRKRRVHFHAFMQEVHARIHHLRNDIRYSGDPVAVLAGQLAQETTLLCFDELQAADVADATLIYRLFQGLFDSGVTVVSTSNHPPATLYTGGVQRERFAKLIALIEGRMQVMALSSTADYRHMKLKSLHHVYFHPLGGGAEAFINDVLEHICADTTPREDTLSVQGRVTHFMRYNHSIGRFSFAELCESALGPADYLALSKRLDTVILTGIPRLTAEKRNEAKRFITLIDALYEHKVKLICTAEAAPEQLYSEGDGSFEFRRTVSRLAEMQSAHYLVE
jgi:cell division protein ZapE